MAKSRQRIKGRRQSRPFTMWLRECAEHPNYHQLSAHAKVLLFDLLGRYRGSNNGDLTATFKDLATRGWKSRDTLDRALKALLASGWIVKTRQGGRHRASLYALTIWGIDECGGKLERLPDPAPLNWWRLGHDPEAQALASQDDSLTREAG